MLPANPIVVRTVQGASRRTRHLWVRMLYLGGLIALVSFGLLTKVGMSSHIGLANLAKASTAIFAFVSYAQVAMICLLAPLFMAGAIAQEQAGKTYDILLTTPLSNFQIVVGSLLGRLFFVLALLASGLPLFAILLVFGGVPVSSVFVAFAVSGLVALVVGSMAVTLSVLRAGGRKAVFTFIIAIAAWLVTAYVADLYLLRNPMARTTTWLTPLHPLLVLHATLNQANYRPPAPDTLSAHSGLVRFYLSRPFAAFAAISGLISLALILWSTFFVRSIVQSKGQANLIRRWLRLGDGAGRERRHPPRSVRGNPIAWREAHTRGNRAAGIIGRWGFFAASVAAAFIALILLHTGSISPTQFRLTITILLMVELVVVAMVGIFMSAGAVSAEREDGTLDLILSTPVTPKLYIWGKLRGLVRFLAVLIASPIITMALVSGYTVIGQLLKWPHATVQDTIFRRGVGVPMSHALMLPEAPLLLVLLLVPFVSLCVIVGMNWSLKSKGVLTAVVPTVIIVAVFALVMGFCGLQMRSVPLLGPIINCFSPTTGIIMLVNPWTYNQGFANDPIDGRVLIYIAALMAAGGYSLIVYSMLRAMVSGFDQTVRKLSGTG